MSANDNFETVQPKWATIFKALKKEVTGWRQSNKEKSIKWANKDVLDYLKEDDS